MNDNKRVITGLSLGIDIGSTTAKIVLIDNGKVIYEKYERHFSQVRLKVLEMLDAIKDLTAGKEFTVAVSGSAGMGLAENMGVPFVQEVFVVGELIRAVEPDTSAVIELGGEDAKIIFFDGGTDERMNGTCAGGTGAFIDQMATLLDLDAEQMDKISLDYKKIYPIASRCGVFAKTDIQPLLNQGANKADVAMSIYQAVVNQTIAGLARGRKIKGKVLFLGGPLSFCKGLQKCFKETLKLTDEEAVFPSYARYAVALGTAIYAAKANHSTNYDTLTLAIKSAMNEKPIISSLPPLFANEQEYKEFSDRHAKADVLYKDIESYSGKAYLGIDCGSTTTKLVLLSDKNSSPVALS